MCVGVDAWVGVGVFVCESLSGVACCLLLWILLHCDETCMNMLVCEVLYKKLYFCISVSQRYDVV